jgi:hypothetical protein
METQLGTALSLGLDLLTTVSALGLVIWFVVERFFGGSLTGDLLTRDPLTRAALTRAALTRDPAASLQSLPAFSSSKRSLVGQNVRRRPSSFGARASFGARLAR